MVNWKSSMYLPSMKNSLLFSIPAFIFGFAILFISVLRTASVKPDFSVTATSSYTESNIIPYTLVYPGKILPGSPLWFLKAARDQIWLIVTTNEGRKAELKLLFADKRLAMALSLIEKGDFENGYSTLSKAEKYLEQASIQEMKNREKGMNTSEFLITLSYASLKHQEILRSLVESSSNEVRPFLIKLEDYPKKTYEEAMHALNEKGKQVPKNPFDRE